MFHFLPPPHTPVQNRPLNLVLLNVQTCAVSWHKTNWIDLNRQDMSDIFNDQFYTFYYKEQSASHIQTGTKKRHCPRCTVGTFTVIEQNTDHSTNPFLYIHTSLSFSNSIHWKHATTTAYTSSYLFFYLKHCWSILQSHMVLVEQPDISKTEWSEEWHDDTVKEQSLAETTLSWVNYSLFISLLYYIFIYPKTTLGSFFICRDSTSLLVAWDCLCSLLHFM